MAFALMASAKKQFLFTLIPTHLLRLVFRMHLNGLPFTRK